MCGCGGSVREADRDTQGKEKEWCVWVGGGGSSHQRPFRPVADKLAGPRRGAEEMIKTRGLSAGMTSLWLGRDRAGGTEVITTLAYLSPACLLFGCAR